MADLKVQSNQWLQKIESVQKPAPASAPSKKPASENHPSLRDMANIINCFPRPMVEKPLHFFIQSPKEVINDLRQAKGNEQYKLLLNFNQQLEQMSPEDLRTARDYLGELMASPKNQDDEFLGVLLRAVNQELDNREIGFKPIRIRDVFPSDIRVD